MPYFSRKVVFPIAQFSAMIFPAMNEDFFDIELLSCPVSQHIAYQISLAGGDAAMASRREPMPANCITADSFWSDKSAQQQVLLFFMPAPSVSADTIRKLTEAQAPAVLMAGKTVLAAWGTYAQLKELDILNVPNTMTKIPVAPGEGLVISDAETAYAAQEGLRRQINMRHMKNGVMLVDPASTHISPMARIGKGTYVLPGCLIYGKTSVGEGCRIGPNAMLTDAVIGDKVTVNASQISESSIGSGTTVGPFAYVRPGCAVGEKCRIGDFVELKKAEIGNGTKVSHLTYLGDAKLGEKINVGCGVVTVNYDGKNKFVTEVEDGSFVGCNVNLVAPVHVGKDVYIAAGSTVTEDLPDEALFVARSRGTVKEGWVRQRKESGKL